MYNNDHQTEQDACFDPNIMPEQPPSATAISPEQNDDFSHDQTTTTITPLFSQIHDLLDHNSNAHELDPSMELDPHIQAQNPHLGKLNSSPNCTNEPNIWIPTNVSDMGFGHFGENPTSNATTSDLLTLLHLPKCSFASSSISFGKPSSPSSMGFIGMGELNPNSNPGLTIGDDMNPSGSMGMGMAYDSLFHLNLPSQPCPSLRDLMLQPLSEGYTTGMNMIQPRDLGNGNGSMSSLFGMSRLDYNGDQGNMNNGYGIYQGGDNLHQQHHDHHMHEGNGIFEFNSGNPCLGEGKEGKCPKNFVTERQRRQNFSDKYQHLKSLVPNPSKGDRASIVKDAIDYILELKRTVAELKLLVEKKRIAKERLKRVKNDQDKSSIAGEDDHVQGVDGPALVKPDPDEGYDGLATAQLRSSWLQRRCKDTEVDVRIVDDEVTIKLVQRKIKVNCLLSVSRTLDELHLDLRHVAGGHVGDYYSYLFNSKISEGSAVYASAIANKLIEAVERQYASASVSLQPSTSF